MSFFNLTQLGPQDPFGSATQKTTTQTTDPQTSTERDNDGGVIVTQPQTTGPSSADPPPSFMRQMYGERSTNRLVESPHSHNETSHRKYSDRRIKHQRNEKGPMELYQHQVTTAHDYGWWIKDGGHAPKWAHTDKHAHVNSEMTRYVNEMSLTNKDFSLF